MLRVVLCCVCLCLTSCGSGNYKRREPETAVIKTKVQSVEQRLSIDIFDNNSIRTRAQTVYYFADDKGRTIEVPMREWLRHSEGDQYTGPWR